MAATRTQEPGLKTWIIVTLSLAIASIAAVAVLSDERLQSRPNSAIENTALPESDRDHDRDQIDAASRDQLREILRRSGNGD